MSPVVASAMAAPPPSTYAGTLSIHHPPRKRPLGVYFCTLWQTPLKTKTFPDGSTATPDAWCVVESQRVRATSGVSSGVNPMLAVTPCLSRVVVTDRIGGTPP